MAQVAIHPDNPSRTRLLIWPREHGAWGMLLIPLATGAAVGLLHGRHLISLSLFTVVALAVFCMRTPVESLLGTSPMRVQTPAERRIAVWAVIVFTAIAVLAVDGLVWRGNNAGLFLLGAVAGLLFLVQTAVRKLGRKGRMPAQLIGALGLTSAAAGAYYVVTRQFDLTAASLWLLNWLFAANQVHFVQLRIREARLASRAEKLARGRLFFAGQLMMVLVILLGWRAAFFPAAVMLAFIPVLFRGMIWFLRGPEALRVRRLGFMELAHALAFGVLLVASFRLGA